MNNMNDVILEIFNSIEKGEKLKFKKLSDTQILDSLPFFISHRIEGIAFNTLDSFSEMSRFYDDTYLKQLETVRSLLSVSLCEAKAIFLQGFSRYSTLADLYSQGLRSDIDIYIPHNTVKVFEAKAKKSKFFEYAYDENSLFLADDESIDKTKEQFWANKDYTLTHVGHVELSDSIPITIEDAYLPYLLRNNECLFLTAIEIHHYYSDPNDINILESNREHWPEMGCDRLNITATLYFNLVRLYNGVLGGEKRIRLLIDTACALKNNHIEKIDFDLLNVFISSSKDAYKYYSVCRALSIYHPLFSSLGELSCEKHDEETCYLWLEAFNQSLQS